MPRGGARVGAGRKPTSKPGVVLGMDGARRDDAGTAPQVGVDAGAPPVAIGDLLNPPADVPPAQQALWRLLAPFAVEQRTLTEATTAGFSELCEQLALKQAIAARIEKVKPTSKRADSLLRHYVKLAQRVDSTLARFKLTSFGKAVDGAKTGKPAATNPWAKLAQ